MESQSSFEQALVKIVEKKVEQVGRQKHAAFGRFVYGEANGLRTWRLARIGGRRNITLDEACRMAEFFGQNIAEFIAEIYSEAVAKSLFVPAEKRKPEALLIDAIKRLLAERVTRPSRFYYAVFGRAAGTDIWEEYAKGNFARPITYAETRKIADFFGMKYAEFMEFANQ
jgi:hypothetical protein